MSDIDEKTIDLVNNLKDIPAMPNVVVKVLKLMHSDTAGAPEMGEVIKCDQALCMKLLALVNSAYYGFAKQITSVSMAISLLGLQKAKNIVITVAMGPLMAFKGATFLWKHSIATAIGCEYIANKYKLMNPDDAFVMGFMHDIGKVVLNLVDSERYQKISTPSMKPDERVNIERAVFDTDHSSTGSLLGVRWQLPEPIKDAIKYHHLPLKAKDFTAPSLVNIVNTLVQDDFEDNWYDAKLAEMINLKIENEEVLEIRDEILRLTDIMLKELS